MRAEDETDKLSLDTGVNHFILLQQQLPNPNLLSNIAGIQAGDAKSQKIQYVLIGAVSAVVRATTFVLNNSGDQELGTLRSTTRSARRRALKQRHLSYKTKTKNNL